MGSTLCVPCKQSGVAPSKKKSKNGKGSIDKDKRHGNLESVLL
jgi:hypothetical protein